MKFLDNDDKAENIFLFLSLCCSLIIIIKKKIFGFNNKRAWLPILISHLFYSSFLFLVTIFVYPGIGFYIMRILSLQCRRLCCDHEEVRPDLVCLGKALSGGIMPVSKYSSDVCVFSDPSQN